MTPVSGELRYHVVSKQHAANQVPTLSRIFEISLNLRGILKKGLILFYFRISFSEFRLGETVNICLFTAFCLGQGIHTAIQNLMITLKTTATTTFV